MPPMVPMLLGGLGVSSWAPDYESGGQEFESLRARQLTYGSNTEIWLRRSWLRRISPVEIRIFWHAGLRWRRRWRVPELDD
jgi:hypothetical protein